MGTTLKNVGGEGGRGGEREEGLRAEKLKVYDRALELAVILEEMTRQTPEGRGDLRDQLRRASTSIVLNIAEGAGEFSPSDKARFYRMARRSASECAAIIDLIERTKCARMEAGQARNGTKGVEARRK